MKIKKNLLLTQISNTVNLELLDSGIAHLAGDWNYTDICSPYSRLYYIAQGSGIVHAKGVDYTLRAGHMYLIPNGLHYDCSCNFMVQIWFHLLLSTWHELDILSESSGVCELSVTNEHLEKIGALYQSDDFLSAIQLKSALFVDVIRFAKQMQLSSFGNPPSSLLKKVSSLAQNPVCAKTNCRILADALHLSESSLSKRFKKETGMTIGHYLDRLVLNRARLLLLTTNLPVCEIAAQLGFTDPFYFSKFFKKQLGASPSSFRKSRIDPCR